MTPGTNELVENDIIIAALQSALDKGEHGLRTVPALVKRVIIENRWHERHVQATRERATFHEFQRFVSAHVPEGLGADIATLKRICRDDPEALDAIDRATQGRQGERTDLVPNRNEVERPHGDTRDYALRKLRKDRPDLHAQVLSGEVSAHAAMVEAGFRPKTATVKRDRLAHLESLARLVAEYIEEMRAVDVDYDARIEAIRDELTALGIPTRQD